MNLFSIAFKSIKQRLLTSTLTSLSVALGVMMMIAVLVIFGIVDRTFNQQAIGYDLIVGPKGSDLQLVLSSVYRIAPAIETLPYDYYQQLKNDPRVEEAIPITMGDVTQQGGFPVVGTETTYFLREYAPGKKLLIRGDGFREAFDAIIGAEVARQNGWDIGSQFTLVHGGAESDCHHDEKFTVTGVLKRTGTPNDRTVFTHLNGFYAIAGHETPVEQMVKRYREFFRVIPGGEKDQELKDLIKQAKEEEAKSHGHYHGPDSTVMKDVSAIFLIMKAPPGESAATTSILFAAQVKKGFQAQAVNPIFPMQRLMTQFVGNIRQVLLALTIMIIVVSGIGIFVSIYNSMADRRREISIMRALGAQRTTVFAIILAESILLCFAGGVAGILLGHGLLFFVAPIVEAKSGLLVDPFSFEPIELVLLPALIVLASIVGIIPGLTAYRTDVAKNL